MVNKKNNSLKQRPLVDKVGFAHTLSQVEAFLKRVEEQQGDLREARSRAHNLDSHTFWKAAICPHDDYSYVGYLYPLLLQSVRSKTVFIIAVAHKAASFNLSDDLIFDDFDEWHGIRKPIPVSDMRKVLLDRIPDTSWEVHRPMQETEHSVEAMLPILQYFNPDIEIVPILVPPMAFDRMKIVTDGLAGAIAGIVNERKLSWGKDFSILITTDAVHYGDQGWNTNNPCKRFGLDKEGYMEAVGFENNLIDECLSGKIDEEHLRSFYNQMVDSANYQLPKWTWCGRYSVPAGLMTMIKLAKKLNLPVPEGTLLDYSTSLTHEPIQVNDLDGMGTTAPATLRHWVGYAALGYL